MHKVFIVLKMPAEPCNHELGNLASLPYHARQPVLEYLSILSTAEAQQAKPLRESCRA